MTHQFKLLTEAQAQAVVKNFLETRKEKSATDYEIAQILKWADKALLDATLLELVMDGVVRLDLGAGEEPLFSGVSIAS